MAEHHDEMEQIEALKRWWLENRAFVIAGIVLGVAVVGGWRAWEWHENRQSEQAAALYDQLGDALTAKDESKAQTLGRQLASDYARTPYAANAALRLARLEVEAGRHAAARQQLEWAVANARDIEIATLARTRLARLQIADGEAAAALTTLAGAPAGAFDALVEDARGDAHAALGDVAAARTAWTAALAASEGNLADRDLIELKLESLGPAAAPATTPTNASTPATAAGGGAP